MFFHVFLLLLLLFAALSLFNSYAYGSVSYDCYGLHVFSVQEMTKCGLTIVIFGYILLIGNERVHARDRFSSTEISGK